MSITRPAVRGTISKAETIDAITAACDWLEANPKKHTTGTYAIDMLGRPCPPTDDIADCFCMVGRIVHELHSEAEGYEPSILFNRLTKEYLGGKLDTASVAKINDAKGRIFKRAGRRKAIKMMRELVKDAQPA